MSMDKPLAADPMSLDEPTTRLAVDPGAMFTLPPRLFLVQ